MRLAPLKLRARTIPPGTLVKTMTGGGGGYGDSRERPAGEVLADVVDGYLSIAAAERDYGVVIDPASVTINDAATERLRASRGAHTL